MPMPKCTSIKPQIKLANNKTNWNYKWQDENIRMVIFGPSNGLGGGQYGASNLVLII